MKVTVDVISSDPRNIYKSSVLDSQLYTLKHFMINNGRNFHVLNWLFLYNRDFRIWVAETMEEINEIKNLPSKKNDSIVHVID